MVFARVGTPENPENKLTVTRQLYERMRMCTDDGVHSEWLDSTQRLRQSFLLGDLVLNIFFVCVIHAMRVRLGETHIF